ncbi:hypothetical protein FRC17_006384, partial [Serendipita sp. 399]
MVAAPTSTTPLSNSTPTIESFQLAIPPLSTVAAIKQRQQQQLQQQLRASPLESHAETQLQAFVDVPRIWTGLWQLSSPAWGTAPAARIRREMRKHVDKGFTAF